MARNKLFHYKVLKNVHAKQPYHWICVATNGEIRYTAENYTQKHNAIKAIVIDIKYRIKGVCSFEDCTGEVGKIYKAVKRVLS